MRCCCDCCCFDGLYIMLIPLSRCNETNYFPTLDLLVTSITCDRSSVGDRQWLQLSLRDATELEDSIDAHSSVNEKKVEPSLLDEFGSSSHVTFEEILALHRARLCCIDIARVYHSINSCIITIYRRPQQRLAREQMIRRIGANIHQSSWICSRRSRILRLEIEVVLVQRSAHSDKGGAGIEGFGGSQCS